MTSGLRSHLLARDALVVRVLGAPQFLDNLDQGLPFIQGLEYLGKLRVKPGE